VKVGKAIDADVPEETTFHRKNYYYPDLPKNFQITQYDAPICQDGQLEFSHESDRRAVDIRRAHLEEDPGSIKHVREGSGPLDSRTTGIDRADYTLIDYNRAGTPLMEIVTQPDFRAPARCGRSSKARRGAGVPGHLRRDAGRQPAHRRQPLAGRRRGGG